MGEFPMVIFEDELLVSTGVLILESKALGGI